MQRYLEKEIEETLKTKMVLIYGPRQVGKTTLSCQMNSSYEYFNYDNNKQRKKLIAEDWDHDCELLVFDEIHKMKKWKLWLKGIFDVNKKQKILVTGSARLETHRRVGDSMAGRYFEYQLFPFDLKELKDLNFGNTAENLQRLLNFSGFPEPFLNNNGAFYKKWRRTHLDVIIKQDMIESGVVKKISDLMFLVDLAIERVGSVFSYHSLKEDLSSDDKTVKRWMMALENSYVLFKITPFSLKLKNMLKKAPKYYFYDLPRIDNEGAKLENFVALSLFKEIQYRNQVLGEEYSLHYLRDNNQNEIDFLIAKDKKPLIMIEVKTKDKEPSKNFLLFDEKLKKINSKVEKIQLVKELKKEFLNKDGIYVKDLAKWLEKMPF